MKIKTLIIVSFAVIAMCSFALDKVEVTGVTARQRYPWNGKVDIDFVLDSKPTEPYQMFVEAYDNVGKTNLQVKSVYAEGLGFCDNPTMVNESTSRIIWDATQDVYNGFKCTNVLVTCRDSRTVNDVYRYLIVDLSAGPSASKYSFSYTNCPPDGGWTEDYMTQKLVLRRIDPGEIMMGSSVNEPGHQDNEDYHRVSITKPYYIGVFELTAAQYSLIMGGASAETQPVTCPWDEIRGWDVSSEVQVTVDNPSYGNGYWLTLTSIQKQQPTSYCWPLSSEVYGDSIMGKLRERTGLAFDLPTEAQWEKACRAGALTELNIGCTNSIENAARISGDKKQDPTGTHYLYVGNYLPNAYGLYDMSGNLSEWCLDVANDHLGNNFQEDPKGNTIMYESAYLLSSYSTSGNYNFSYNGVTYAVFSPNSYAGTRISYGYYGIKRVVRGTGARSAARSSALNVNTSGEAFTTGINGVKASFTNPRFGVRISLNMP